MSEASTTTSATAANEASLPFESVGICLSPGSFAGLSFSASLGSTTVASGSLPCAIVNPPGQRYQPAIVAQAAASLCVMFPERLWVALGSGEARFVACGQRARAISLPVRDDS